MLDICGLIQWMAENQSWSKFVTELYQTVTARGALSANQLSAIKVTKATSDARNASWNTERRAIAEQKAVPVDLTTIERMFDEALASGRKKLIYRAEGLKMSPAKETSKKRGCDLREDGWWGLFG